MDDQYWMGLALKEAEKARKAGEVPVGAVAVCQGRKIASAHNRSISHDDPTAHAEILCLRRAARRLKNYRLAGTILYVTVEPCAMCAGALLWARISKVVFGCWDEKSGACGSVLHLAKFKKFSHRFQSVGGVREEECRGTLQRFFLEKRATQKIWG
ncbi:MAG: nucleoside deaminase [Elusimicrobia bacterium]|nr:nucleoside deaminase [Elusimicrobiota bacterium]